MRVFVSEFLCGGSWPEPDLNLSLAREGSAMLRALISDFQLLTDVDVVTTWDARLGPAPFNAGNVVSVESPTDEWEQFVALATDADAVFVIAPEFDGILADRVRWLEDRNLPHRGCSSAAIRLCTDKLRLAEHLSDEGVTTIPTFLCDEDFCETGLPASFGTDSGFVPIVVKPRDGAGSTRVQLISRQDEWNVWRRMHREEIAASGLIAQPWFSGEPVSVGMLITSHRRGVEPGSLAEAFPVATQILSDDGCFRYLGGEVRSPFLRTELAARVQETALEACRSVPGLSGYVGVDLLVDLKEEQAPVVVEINPRLTTSYLGYSALCVDNIAGRWLHGAGCGAPFRWKPDCVKYGPSGLSPSNVSSPTEVLGVSPERETS